VTPRRCGANVPRRGGVFAANPDAVATRR